MKAKHPILLAVLILVVVAVLYPLSYPPVRVMAEDSPIAMKWVITVYRPILMGMNYDTPLGHVFDHYCWQCGIANYLLRDVYTEQRRDLPSEF
ncbi:hypothetical protein [Planctomicrobium piriforme]|uniref:Uncharacterized protein n=1 Tax=Planctomicrobium piriforme TaxID=1576369 RepID=A0A1I3KBW0_9PLAN|nr:hypothetical protein [Planctomicrobium piriforme]SFI69685.1 hypothetical protein SAMN05421753_111173 [Planctomicrobium piriforme]